MPEYNQTHCARCTTKIPKPDYGVILCPTCEYEWLQQVEAQRDFILERLEANRNSNEPTIINNVK